MKTGRIDVRLEPGQIKLFAQLAVKIGISKSVLFRSFIQALDDLYNRNNGKIIFPLYLLGLEEEFQLRQTHKKAKNNKPK